MSGKLKSYTMAFKRNVLKELDRNNGNIAKRPEIVIWIEKIFADGGLNVILSSMK